MQLRIKENKPLNLNDQLNAIKKGLLAEPEINYLPTPTAADATTGGIIGKDDEFYITKNGRPRRVNKTGIDGSLGLARYIQFPTPSAGDAGRKGSAELWNEYENGGRTTGYRLRNYIQAFPTPRAKSGKPSCLHGDGGLDLQTAVQIWPTPRSSMPGSRPNGKGGRILAEEVKKAGNGQEGQLNPLWVEAMMGYPLYWTDGDKKPVEVDYPFAWLDGTWEKDIPRITTNKKNRVNRLKCLGNSVVPEIPALIWLMIKSFLGGKK